MQHMQIRTRAQLSLEQEAKRKENTTKPHSVKKKKQRRKELMKGERKKLRGSKNKFALPLRIHP